jgi:hypothetical protein
MDVSLRKMYRRYTRLRRKREERERVESELRQADGTDEPDEIREIRQDPVRLLELAGFTPDPWQAEFIRSTAKREMLLCSRQTGKTTISAAKALATALTRRRCDVLVFSRALRQSVEFLRRASWFWAQSGKLLAAVTENKTEVEFENGSRIISLPGNPNGVVGFSAGLVIIDEASRVMDDLYYFVRPMVAATNGDMIALSTPFGKRGWFFSEWEGLGADGKPKKAGTDPWKRTKITALECSRLSAEFLEESRASMGEMFFGQEFMCEYVDTVMGVFPQWAIDRAMSDEVEEMRWGEAFASKPLEKMFV